MSYSEMTEQQILTQIELSSLMKEIIRRRLLSHAIDNGLDISNVNLNVYANSYEGTYREEFNEMIDEILEDFEKSLKER